MKDERITELFTKVANCVDILDKMVRNLEEQVEMLNAKIDALEKSDDRK